MKLKVVLVEEACSNNKSSSPVVSRRKLYITIHIHLVHFYIIAVQFIVSAVIMTWIPTGKTLQV